MNHTFRVVRADYLPGAEMLIELEWVPGWLFQFFGSKPYFEQYRGWCTVWHKYPSGHRCDTFLESELADIWTARQWEVADAERSAP